MGTLIGTVPTWNRPKWAISPTWAGPTADRRGGGGRANPGGPPDGPSNNDPLGDDDHSDGEMHSAFAIGAILLALGVLCASCDSGTQVIPTEPLDDADNPGTDTPPTNDTGPGDIAKDIDDLLSPSADDGSAADISVEADTAADATSVDALTGSDIPPEDTPPLITDSAADTSADAVADTTPTDGGSDTPDEETADVGPLIPSVTFCTAKAGNECLADAPALTATLVQVGATILLKADSGAGAAAVSLDPLHFLNPQNSPIAVTLVNANGIYPDVFTTAAGTPLHFALPATSVYITDPDDPAYYEETNIYLYPPEWTVAELPDVTLTVEAISNPFAPGNPPVSVLWLRGLQSFVAPGTQQDAECTARYFWPCWPILNPVVTP